MDRSRFYRLVLNLKNKLGYVAKFVWFVMMEKVLVTMITKGSSDMSAVVL